MNYHLDGVECLVNWHLPPSWLVSVGNLKRARWRGQVYEQFSAQALSVRHFFRTLFNYLILFHRLLAQGHPPPPTDPLVDWGVKG